MTKVTALFWDVGGVILSNGWDVDARAAAIKRFDLDGDDFEHRHEFIVEDFERGRVTLEEYLDRTVFYRARAFSVEEFTAFLFAQSTEKAGTRTLLDELTAARRFLFFTLNNEAAELNRYRIQKFQLERNFTAFLSSCYLGVRKPGEAIYKLALEITQRPAEECIFIDDRPGNLEAPRRLGMQTIQFRDPDQLRADLASRGVTAN